MTDEFSAFSRAACAIAICASVLGFGGPAAAAPLSLREGLFGPRTVEGRQVPAPPIARYISEDGPAFVLDRTQLQPLLKFENSSEVWVLLSQPGPRGDMIYKNDLGEPVLRATRLGGVTIFTEQRPGGAAAALAGGGAPIRLLPMTPQALIERLAQASLRASRAARHLIIFDAEAAPQSSPVLFADAAMVASVAVLRIAEEPEGRSKLGRLQRVFLMEGRKVSARLEKGTMMITIVSRLGLAGRPSSERIVQAANTGR